MNSVLRSGESSCWVCASPNLQIVKAANITENLTSEAFAITDSHYGQTGEIQRCQNCGFLQCSSLDNVLSFYEQLEDVGYEETRAERMLQAKKLVEILHKYRSIAVLKSVRADREFQVPFMKGRQRGFGDTPSRTTAVDLGGSFGPHPFEKRSNGTLLDIGAGSGILVEAALKMGYDAEGIEPSSWLQQQAQNYQLPVYAGSFPDATPRQTYDIVTLIDVIEHVPNPAEVVAEVAKILSTDGIVAVATPDVSSLVARILGWKWWHFRVAHIGYFNRKTLDLIMANAGFECVKMTRPTWYFPAEYLLERLAKYLPVRLPISTPAWLQKIVIPLNLGDSLLGIYQLKGKTE